jgi:hypothetical protein
VALLALLTGCDDSGGTPPGPDVDVVGRWVPEEAYVDNRSPVFDVRDAIIRFNPDGTWAASTDSCNDLDGTYDVDGDEWSAAIPSFVGGVGCTWGEVPYDRLIVSTAGRIERERNRLTFYDDKGTAVLELRAYSGRPAPYKDIHGDELEGIWRPAMLFGRRITYQGPYGDLVLRKQVSIEEGCRWFHGQLNVGPGGGIVPDMTSTPIGCPAWVGADDVGPDTARALRSAVRVQVDRDRLRLYSPGHRLIGVFASAPAS